MAEVFSNRQGMGYVSKPPAQEWGGMLEKILTHFERDFTRENGMALPPMLDMGGNGVTASPAVVFGRSGASGGATVGDTGSNPTVGIESVPFEKLPLDGGFVVGNIGISGVENSLATAIADSAPPQSPGRDVRDGELERLRKIEANHEKDKASLARQKQPALARSESHDVGHAEGTGDETDSTEKITDAIYKNIAKIIQGSSQ